MASALHTKITSYALSFGQELADAVSTSPTTTGTSPTKAWTQRNLIAKTNEGPSNGANDCWEFVTSTTSTLNSYHQQSASASFASADFSDNDYGFGFWFKLNALPTQNSSTDLVLCTATSTTSEFRISVTGTTFTGNASKLAVFFGGTTPTTTYSSETLVAGKWYYVAIRKTGTGSLNHIYYLNGIQFGTATNANTSAVGTLLFGKSTGSALEGNKFWLSNIHLASSSVLDATAISQIYDVGTKGYEQQVALAGAPYYYLKLNSTSGSSLQDSSSNGWATVLSGTPTWLTTANSISKGGVFLPSATWAGFNSNPTIQYTATNSIAFWFKKASAPTSLMGVTYTFWDSSNNLDTYVGTDGKLYWRIRIGNTAQTALTTSANICDNAWHHIVITRNGTSAKMYVDGTLNSSTTYTSAAGFPGAASFTPFGGADTYWDEFAYWNNIELSSITVGMLYNSGISTVSVNASGVTAATASSTSPDAVVNTTSTVDLTYNAAVVGTANSVAVDPLVSATKNIDIAAEPMNGTNALFVDPTISVTANINYAASVLTASSLMVNPTVATTKTVDVLATPLLVSALMSARVYAGDSVQDTSYSISIRKLTPTTNNTGNSGFIIGGTRNENVVTVTDALALKANSGFPTYNTIIKAKFNSAHVSYTTSGDITPSNYFKVYVFTANPSTSFDTMTLANMPAKEYLWTTRLVDDGSSGQYYLDLTAAFADIRAHTYGVYIEIDTDTIGGSSTGAYYDRTEWTGTNLNNQLLYVLTSEFISSNSNAAVSTASADIVAPTVYTEKYVDVMASPITASALIVAPSVVAATSVTISDGVLTASAASVSPQVSGSADFAPGHFEADARTGTNDPVITTVSNKTITSSVLTASATFVDPAHSIGEINETTPMTASAIFADPAVYIVMHKNIAANSMVADATTVNPAYQQQFNALIKPDTVNASARLVPPPAYELLTDDIWYNRLAAQNDGITNYASFVKFFKQQTGQTNGTVTNDLPGETNNGDLTGTLTVGSSDLVGRKAVRLQGLIDHNPGNYYPALTRKTWSLETNIKTTTANQVLAQGTTVNPDVSYDYWSGNITLVNGKISVNTNLGIDKNATPTYNSTSVIGTSNIADGNWHHVVVQHDGTRTQIWVDGQLDVQSLSFVAPNVPVPSQIGSATSDFYVSVWSLSEGVLLSERELALNYWASLKYSPIQPAPLTASVVSGNHIGKGNQKKAIMFYYWDTRSQDNPNFYYNAQGGFSTSTQRQVSGIYQENKEQGEFDIDYGINLSTWNAGSDGLGGQDFYGWKVYPVDITGKYVSPAVKQSKYSNITTASSGTGLTWPQSDGFKDSRYGYNRYIDVLNDIDLTDVDAIFFRNYPDDQIERAQFMQDQTVDEYFRIYEKQLHEDFLVSLRKAVDTGVSLLVNHPQLAVDLGIVDRVEIVEQLSDYGSTAEGNYTGGGDPRSRALSPAGTLDDNGWYVDSYRNNRFRVVNTIAGLTDEPTAILTDYAYWKPGANAGFTNIARNLSKVDYKPNGLLIGDEFIIHSIPATEGTTTSLRRMLAVPSANVKSGKPVTKFGASIYNGTTLVSNPYSDYVTTIAVEPGDSLNGTAVGGKIFVSFTDLNKVQIDGTGAPIEYWSVETSTRKVLDILLSRGTITQEQYDQYDLNTYDTQYENNQISSQEFALRNYWSQNDWDLAVGASGSTGQVIDVNQNGNAAGQQNRTATRTISDTAANNIYSLGGSSWFTLTVGRQFDVFKVYSKSMLSRGLTWLATRVTEAGTVTRPIALGSYATIVNPVVQAEKNVTINVQAMLSSATITQGGYAKDRTIISLPMTAQATITPKVTLINAPVLTASARLADNIEEIVYQADQVVMYILHTDAILYVREDVIK